MKNKKAQDGLMEKLKACKAKNQKQKAVLRTQRWRMRIKMKDISNTEAAITSPFSSRTTEYRAIQRAKLCLPLTPEKRAHVVEKLTESPSVNPVLEDKGAVVSKRRKKELGIGEKVLRNFEQSLKDTKSYGQSEKLKTVHDSLKHGALYSVATKYGLQKHLKQVLNFGKIQG